jgi:hypothetical protein
MVMRSLLADLIRLKGPASFAGGTLAEPAGALLASALPHSPQKSSPGSFDAPH